MKTLTSQDVFTMIRNHLFLHHTAKKALSPHNHSEKEPSVLLMSVNFCLSVV